MCEVGCDRFENKTGGIFGLGIISLNSKELAVSVDSHNPQIYYQVKAWRIYIQALIFTHIFILKSISVMQKSLWYT